MCNHNIYANLGRVDLNCHPKWSILGSASLRNLRLETKRFFSLVLYNFPVVFISCLDERFALCTLNSLGISHFNEYRVPKTMIGSLITINVKVSRCF
jgi:hypothetical protein